MNKPGPNNKYSEFYDKINKLQEGMSLIGSSVSIDAMPHDTFITYLEKVDWAYLNRFKAEEKREMFSKIFDSLKEFRLGMYLCGVDIGFKRIQWLASLGFITAPMRNGVAKKHSQLVQEKYVNKFYLNAKGEMVGYLARDEEYLKKAVVDYDDNIGNELNEDDIYIQDCLRKQAVRPEIKREDWAIEDVFDLPIDLVEFIEAVNKGWQHFENTKGWTRFNTYREQAYVWLRRDYKMEESWSIDRKVEFIVAERERCLTNSLYLCNKLLWYKDSDNKFKGEEKFVAWKSQEAILFLIDLGLSLIIGKLRQIGLTTVIGGLFGIRTMLSKNYFCKMIAQKGDKSEEIFGDKVKYAISKTVDYMKPTIPNWSTSEVRFGFSNNKGGESSTESHFEVSAPSEDAINAGTPSAVLLDEIGFMKLFGAIISQGRPTMFKNKGGKMLMTKQLIAWGTGGNTGGTGSPMETEWKAAKEAFAERNFRYGLIPLFLNYYAKPGHNDAFYLAEKQFYYQKKKKAGEADPKIVFHQSFPITEDDMFLQSSDTVVSIAIINMHIERINRKVAEEKLVCKRGYFEPVFDTDKPRGEDAYVPYSIIGCRFIPADESLIQEDSEFSCVTIYQEPDLKWENRYYKGTDPIITSSGHSKFSTTIKDAKDKKRTVAKMNYKSKDYRYEYLQSLLLNLYYSRDITGRKIGIVENLEMNVGGEYYNFVCELGYSHIFMGNKMLPGNLQTSTMSVGISKKGHNATAIVNRLEEMLIECANQIDSIEFWVQLKTFVKKETRTGFTYEPENKKIHWDDEIDSEVYASIACDCYSRRTIRYMEDADYRTEVSKKKKYYLDANYNVRIGTVSQISKMRMLNQIRA